MPIREWVRLDVGLLDDDRFEQLTPEQRSAWTVAYLLIARGGDAVRDRPRLAHLLAKQGVADAIRLVDELDSAGWIVDAGRTEGITLRGYEKAQPLYRGLSDTPEAKALRNAKRPTTRAERAARGASVERVERHSTDSTDSTDITRKRARGGATVERVERGARKAGPVRSLKDLLRENGYDPEKKPGSTS